MRDEARLEQMRSTLAADGYHLSVDELDSGYDVRITADPEGLRRLPRAQEGAGEHARADPRRRRRRDPAHLPERRGGGETPTA